MLTGKKSGLLRLRIKKAGRSLNDADSLIESLDLVDRSSLRRDLCDNVEAKILWVHIFLEGIGELLGRAGRNRDAIFGARQVLYNSSAEGASLGQSLQSREEALDAIYNDGNILVVFEFEESLGRTFIDQLDAEDLSFRECSRDSYSEVGHSWGGFFDLLQR